MNQFVRWTIVSASCFLVIGICVELTHAAGIPADVQANARQRVDGGAAPGIIIGLINDEGRAYFGYGQTSLENGRTPDEHTLFEIGSITKVFTATVLANQVLRGQAKLDDPVQVHLPETVKMPTRNEQAITLEHLATHRSGLPRLPDNFNPADPANPYADYTTELMYEFISGYDLTRDVGEKYEYSNLAMGLLGHVVSRIGGQPYERLVVETICNPLKMKDTRIALSADQRGRLAIGHMDGKAVLNWDLPALAGAGALRSTAADMLTFLAAQMAKVDTDLSKAMALTKQSRFDTEQSNVKIALGWHVGLGFGTEGFIHSGGTGGYRSFCGFDPKAKVGAVVLVNSTEEIEDIGLHLLEPKYRLKKERKVAEVDANVLEDYIGNYELAPGKVLNVTRDGDKLLAQLTGQGRFQIYPEAKDEFFYRIVNAQITFERNNAKAVTGLVLHQGGDHRAKKLGPEYQPPEPPKEVPIDPDLVLRYVGKYQLAPGVFFDVTARRGRLKVKLTGQPAVPVYPESETKFFYKVVDAQITFVAKGNEPATSLILHQGGIDQTAKRVE